MQTRLLMNLWRKRCERWSSSSRGEWKRNTVLFYYLFSCNCIYSLLLYMCCAFCLILLGAQKFCFYQSLSFPSSATGLGDCLKARSRMAGNISFKDWSSSRVRYNCWWWFLLIQVWSDRWLPGVRRHSIFVLWQVTAGYLGGSFKVMVYFSTGVSLLYEDRVQFGKIGVESNLLRAEVMVCKGLTILQLFWCVLDDSWFCGCKY